MLMDLSQKEKWLCSCQFGQAARLGESQEKHRAAETPHHLPTELSYPQEGPMEELAASAGRRSSVVSGASGQVGVPGHSQCSWAQLVFLGTTGVPGHGGSASPNVTL